MKVPSTCAALATLLSSNYNSTDRYIPTGNRSDLSAYLSSNGILLTMCMFDFCALDPRENHISASWIQNATTGFRIIPGSQIGYIIDPTALGIKCIYPTDAATVGRSNAGCGPTHADPIFGDGGYGHANIISRYYYKKLVQRVEQLNFGSRNASEIPCSMRYSMLMGGGGGHGPYGRKRHHATSAITWTSNYELNTTEFSTMLRTIASYEEPFMGRPTCKTDDEIPDLNDSENVFIYMDATTWDPVSEWQNVMDSMRNIFAKYSPIFWNEIVLDLPATTMNSALLAIFIIIDPTMDDETIKDTYERAVLESTLLDTDATKRKPILLINVTALEHNEPLFTCADDDWYDKIMWNNYNDSHYTDVNKNATTTTKAKSTNYVAIKLKEIP